jgi:predicted enzyme related to lactoylglutathione lyase
LIETSWQRPLYAKNVDRVVAFYSAVLGFQIGAADASLRKSLLQSQSQRCDGLDPEGNVIQFREPAHE